jgi:hypothetical protein
VDDLVYYTSSKEIACRELMGEYLIFSGFARETLVVHHSAFRLIQLLQGKRYTYDEILDVLEKESDIFDDDGFANFVSTSLEQFIDIGVLDYSRFNC